MLNVMQTHCSCGPVMSDDHHDLSLHACLKTSPGQGPRALMESKPAISLVIYRQAVLDSLVELYFKQAIQ